MGNVQVLNGFYPSASPIESPTGSEIFDYSDDINSAEPSTRLSNDDKIICEYCQEYCFPQFHEQHTRICSCNPQNIQGSSWFQFSRNKNNSQSNKNTELEKTPCNYCNEPCFMKYKDDHQRICPKNPENIKITCRYCTVTLSLISYQSHLETCEDTHHQRRRSVNSTRAPKSFPSNLRRIKTTNEITFEKSERTIPVRNIVKQEHDCSVCLETIKSNFDLRTLSCDHKFHKHCIQKWSCIQKKCPMCRKEFF